MSDFSGIHTSLLQLHAFSADQLQLFTSRLSIKKLRKKEFLLKPDQISKSLSFIIAGGLRFYTNTDESELTINFFTENQWVADIESFLMQLPSKNYIEAVEKSEIASLTLKDLHELMDIHPGFRMLNALIANLTIPTTHLAALRTLGPDRRYKELLLNHPDWINRFPQMQIASYLGMSPETLSRVRSRIA